MIDINEQGELHDLLLNLKDLGFHSDVEIVMLIGTLFKSLSIEAKRTAFYNIKNHLKSAQAVHLNEVFKDVTY